LTSERARRQQLESSLDETRQLQASLHESAARLADQHIELKGLREDADHLEPLAAVGRLAFTVSDDVQICLVSAETCVRRLLGQNTGDDTLRADLEVLRRDLSQAARLLRQVARLGAKP
jgi:multidrug resistance efflux pump